MNKIKDFLDKYYQIIFFILLFYGLSIFIFLKEINIIFFQYTDLNILTIYRVLIIISSILFLFFMKKRGNLFLLLFALIHFLFFYNSIFGTEIKFYMDFKSFYKSISIVTREMDHALNDKIKLLTINLFNILLPLIILSFCKNINFSINQFKYISLKLCNIFLYFILFYLLFRFIFINLDTYPLIKLIKINYLYFLNIGTEFVNIHSMIYILNIHFLLIIDSFQDLKIKENKKNLINLILIPICLLLSGTTIHLAICIMSAIVYFIYFGIKKKYLYLLIFCSIFLILISFTELLHFYLNNNPFDYLRSGSGLNAIYVRIMNIYFFLFYPINFNLFIGNNIFVDNIYTYPHNIFVDIFVNTGLVGLMIFLIVIVHLFKEIKKNLSKNNFFIHIILFQSFLLANLSGFLFSNIIFNSALALSMLIIQKKYKFNKY